MVELSSLMASAAPAILHSAEPALGRGSSPKDFQSFVPFQAKRQERAKSASVQLCTQRFDEKGQSPPVLAFQGESYQHPSVDNKQVLVDVQDSRSDSVLFVFGIAEQCTRHEKILKYLKSGSNTEQGLDISLLSELMGFQTLAFDTSPQSYAIDDSVYEIALDEHQHYLRAEKKIVLPSPLLEFVGKLSASSALSIDENGRVILTGNGDEMRDLLSIVADYNLSKRPSSGGKAGLLVPYFERKMFSRAKNRVSTSEFVQVSVDSLKSSANLKEKSISRKKQNGKAISTEQDWYQKNYVRACEAFLSGLVSKDNAVVSIKKSGPEISEVLTKFSIGIAGTGLAVLLSVACKTAGARVPLSATRLLNTNLLNTGVGLSLFWLSWAVNGLRDAVTAIFKDSSKTKLKDEDVAVKIERSMKDIVLRATALLALAIMRFA